jgi:hypothetical protein
MTSVSHKPAHFQVLECNSKEDECHANRPGSEQGSNFKPTKPNLDNRSILQSYDRHPPLKYSSRIAEFRPLRPTSAQPRRSRVEQTFVPGISPEQFAEDSHIQASAGVGEGQEAPGVELHQHSLDPTVHQVARQAADARRHRARPTGRSTHQGTDAFVESD